MLGHRTKNNQLFFVGYLETAMGYTLNKLVYYMTYFSGVSHYR